MDYTYGLGGAPIGFPTLLSSSIMQFKVASSLGTLC